MVKKIIPPDIADELRSLYAEYPIAAACALAALKSEPAGHELKGHALQRFLAEHEKVAKIGGRIREIQGDE